MTTVTIFRVLLMVSISLWATEFVVSEYYSQTAIDDVADLLLWNGYGSQIPANIFLYFGYYLLRIGLLVALFFFNQQARLLYFVTVPSLAVVSLFYGVAVVLPVQNFIGVVNTLLTGGLLVLLLNNELKDRFHR